VKPDIKSFSREELAQQFEVWNEPDYRLTQLLEWLYLKRATTWEAMSNMPKALRERLKESYQLAVLEMARRQGARDETQKFLWRLPDNAFIESVLIPANPALYSEASDRHTLCVSTQVGCAYGCKFCASGLKGWKRNLAPFEIVEQVMALERMLHEDKPEGAPKQPEVWRQICNLVIMGMGEPLANYDALLKALRILNAPWGGGIGARKITISTSGLVPQIRRLAGEPEQFRLAISLHGATDAVRDRIMPVNRRYPLGQLIPACEEYLEKKGKMISFEYILIAGVNDGLDQVEPLSALARRLHAKVNLIPYNQVEGLEWTRPEPAVQEAFLEKLKRNRIPATLRREKGGEIDAACGQLRLRTEKEMAAAGSKEG
jgi:23S rRNA (adenine2503-C2)-methyltransferase